MHSGYLCFQAIFAIETTYAAELPMSLGNTSLQATYAFELPIPLHLGYLCFLATYNFAHIGSQCNIYINNNNNKKQNKKSKNLSLLILDSPEGLPSLLSLLMGYLHSRAYWWATFAVKPTNWLPSPSSLQMGRLHRQAYWRAKFTGKPNDGLPCKCKCKKD